MVYSRRFAISIQVSDYTERIIRYTRTNSQIYE